ncbi:DUF2652 domain-containing protein [Modestobacter versicolor]|uniref:DUF2652 domain-containing protein n=1 Tax=Modestobacter versicolor TaxID=429133 RepID=A0A323VEH7_9ACTN|nr:DUF2652 domain-containing protein [Modestobacter versicolor]MBB3675170.1 hypothetical protein [Modestobacter versicolor]PZA23011.1 DUF2652 domain-containing protein [Modestobacter versicolor]
MATRRALLLIADMGGYTEYMQFHRSMLGHAEAVTRRLLDQIVDAAPGFDLVEIEGDAAFLSRDADGLDGAATLSAVTGAAVAMHRAFHAQRRLVELNMCPCKSCTRTSALKLKFVAHVGDVATQTIRRRKKLVGVDVIHVHRLLKNPVPVPEYLLVSDELYQAGGPSSAELVVQELAQDLEGIGRVQTFYADVADLAPPPAPSRDPSWLVRIGATLDMVGRGLPHVVPRRRPRSLVPSG